MEGIGKTESSKDPDELKLAGDNQSRCSFLPGVSEDKLPGADLNSEIAWLVRHSEFCSFSVPSRLKVALS